MFSRVSRRRRRAVEYSALAPIPISDLNPDDRLHVERGGMTRLRGHSDGGMTGRFCEALPAEVI